VSIDENITKIIESTDLKNLIYCARITFSMGKNTMRQGNDMGK